MALVLLASGAPVWAQLLSVEWFDSHEGASYLARVVEVRECWGDGMPSARWFPDLAGGRGYPFLSFYAPLSFWIASAVSFVTEITTAWKLVVIGATYAGLAGAYRLARNGLGPLPSLVAAWFYAYAPYHLRDLWTRGDLAEYTAMGVLPWAIHSVLRLARGTGPGPVLRAGCWIGALAIMHNVLAFLGAGVLAAVLGVAAALPDGPSPRRVLRAGFLAALVALGASMFFWLPALAERSWVHLERLREGHFEIARHFVSFGDLFAFTRPARVHVPGRAEAMTFELGTVLLPALLAPWGWRDRETRRVLVLGGVLATAAVLLCLRVSGPVYAAVPLLDFVGFPWRFLSITTLGMALLAAVGSAQVVERLGARFAATVGFAALAIVPVRDLLGPTAPLPLQPWMLDAEAYRQAEFTATVADEYVPIWARRDEPLPFREGLAATKPAEFTPVNRTATRWRFSVRVEEPADVILRRYYYPGWRATIDGRVVAVKPREISGYTQLAVPAGTHSVEVEFRATRLRRAASVVSLGVGMAAFGGAALVRRRRRSREHGGGEREETR